MLFSASVMDVLLDIAGMLYKGGKMKTRISGKLQPRSNQILDIDL